MKKYICMSTCLLFFALVSCYNEERAEATFLRYYDDAHTQLKVKGEIINGMEDGMWEFYNEKGSIVERGVYKNGMPIGEWKYDYPLLDSSVVWNACKNVMGEFAFSLPESFSESELDNDTSVFTAIDNGRGDIFTISDLGAATEIELQNYFEKTKQDFGSDFELLNCSSLDVKTDSLNFLFDNFFVKHKKIKTELVHFNIYTRIGDFGGLDHPFSVWFDHLISVGFDHPVFCRNNVC